MALREVEDACEDKDAKLKTLLTDLEVIQSEVELIRRQKNLELKQVHQEYMDKEHKLIQFMIDNSGLDLSAKPEEDQPEEMTIQSLLTLFLKQKTSQVPE